jgi:hypothetical protein
MPQTDLTEEEFQFAGLVSRCACLGHARVSGHVDHEEKCIDLRQGAKHAVLSYDFDGSGVYGYAMLIDGRFEAGTAEGRLDADALPSDLTEYLHANAPE